MTDLLIIEAPSDAQLLTIRHMLAERGLEPPDGPEGRDTPQGAEKPQEVEKWPV
jgi:hypothetical protein